MERDYIVHLHCADGKWSGTVRGTRGECSFSGIPSLLEHLQVDPFTHLTRLEQMARTDPLTGLLNRRGITEEVERTLDGGGACAAVLMVDVDNLKEINDTWGHLKGDEILEKVAWAIRQAGGSESIAGRFGGDEFVLVFWKNKSEEELRQIGKEICRLAVLSEQKIQFSVSVGACRSGEDYDRMVEEADLALYQVKRTGKHGVALGGIR